MLQDIIYTLVKRVEKADDGVWVVLRIDLSAAPSETTLDAARVATPTQKGPNGTAIGIDPVFLMVSPSLQTATKKQITTMQAAETKNSG